MPIVQAGYSLEHSPQQWLVSNFKCELTLCLRAALQAIRAQFRYQRSASSCTAGSYNDRDDLVFAVQTSPVTTVFSDNFETSQGWVTNPNGTDTATTGQWERGDPEATTDNGGKTIRDNRKWSQ